MMMLINGLTGNAGSGGNGSTSRNSISDGRSNSIVGNFLSGSSSPSMNIAKSEKEKDWKFSQCFGVAPSAEITEADMLSAVEFDNTGQYLATGDKGGRIVIFDVDASTPNVNSATKSRSSISSTPGKSIEYKFRCEFQSHEPEFDYLKSLEIEEKINQIKWCPPSGNSQFLLSTNDKTIKLWKISEKHIKTVNTLNVDNTNTSSSISASMGRSSTTMKSTTKFTSPNSLKIPKLAYLETVISCHSRRVYGHAHTYHVNSISVNSDGESFISTDDLRINLWHMDHSNESYIILDIKPDNMEDLKEVITSSEFHPSHCNIFIYSGSLGGIRMSDMREKSLCDQHAKIFQEPDEANEKSFYSEIISSISDCKFSKDGRFIISRDYLSMKIWDVRIENKPIQTFRMHENLRPKLADLYEKEHIFDKFRCITSGDSRYVATGSYNNYFHIYDAQGKNDICLEATNIAATKKKSIGGPFSKSKTIITDPNQLDYSKKVLHMAWNPKESTIAVCAQNQLYIYNR